MNSTEDCFGGLHVVNMGTGPLCANKSETLSP